MKTSLRKIILIPLLISSSIAGAGFFDIIKDIDPSKLTLPAATTTQLASSLSNTDITSALKQALEKGAIAAVDNLSADGGFLNHADVKIPIPSSLQPIASSLRMLGQGHIVDNFQTTLNKAAEEAAPEAAAIFSDAIQDMSIEDAKTILNGPDNAGTEYFRKHSSDRLLERFLPIVKQATNTAGTTASFKQLMASAGSLAGLTGTQTPDIDSFVAQKAVDAMFLRIAEQEKLIRENPAARTTDLLQKVFTQ